MAPTQHNRPENPPPSDPAFLDEYTQSLTTPGQPSQSVPQSLEELALGTNTEQAPSTPAARSDMDQYFGSLAGQQPAAPVPRSWEELAVGSDGARAPSGYTPPARPSILDLYLSSLTADEPSRAAPSTELEFLLGALDPPEFPMSAAGETAFGSERWRWETPFVVPSERDNLQWAQAYFGQKGYDMAFERLRHFELASGEAYSLTPEEVAKVSSTPRVQEANNAQLEAAIAAAVERARQDPSLYGIPQSFSIGETTDRRNPGSGDPDMPLQPWYVVQSGQERDEVHFALGNFSTNTSGVVVVNGPADDGSGIAYDVVYRNNYYDRYNFDEKSVDYGNGPGDWLPAAVNNQMMDLHNRGFAQNFDQSGSSPITVQQGFHAPAGLAAGGEVTGPGSSIGDKIPAWLSDGEFVMNARSTAVNRPFLQALNADPHFLQKLLASRSERGQGAAGPAPAAPACQPATVNISMSNDEDIIGRLKVLAMQWELSH